jgi:putative two-component system response regulator
METRQKLSAEDDAGLILMKSLMKAVEAADIANKEKNEFIAHISHEVKTRLNAIIGFTEILKEAVTEPTLRHYLNNIRSSGDMLLSLVNNSLDIPKINSGAHAFPIPITGTSGSAAVLRNDARALQAPSDQKLQDADSEQNYDDASVHTSLMDAQREWEELSSKESAAALTNVVFAIDDNADNLAIIAHLFAKEQIKMFPFTKGIDAIEAIQKVTPSLILLDIVMPNMDGYEVCRWLKENESTKKIPVIFLTSKSEPNAIVRGFQIGGVDYISKPFRKEELLSRVRTHLKLYETERSLASALKEKEELLDETLKGSIKVLIDILAMTNPEAFAQTIRVRNVAKRMTVRMGLENSWEIEIGVLLSNIGRSVIPQDIVMKKQNGERLTTQENTVFNSHPRAAARFISNIPRLEQVAASIQYQFDDYDPKTEPDIIKDFIRIVFDYDNLIQAGNTQQQALDEMYLRKGRYNPNVMGALEAEVRKLMDGYVVRAVPFEDLKTGMVLADDIRYGNNIILVRRNSELSDVLMEKLQNLRYCGKSYEPIKILEHRMN